MKINTYKSFSIFDENNNSSKILLTNCGFSPKFFNELEQNILILKNNNIKSIKSENGILPLRMKNEKSPQKEVSEVGDKNTYKNKCDNIQKNKSECNISSYTTFPSQDYLNKNNSEIINKKNNNYIIKAYKSKLKKKYENLYEKNSIDLENKNKSKLYHKCCYPGCNRTFSSSGWLKSHLQFHLKQVHDSEYCKLFEKYRSNKKAHKIKKKNKKENNIKSTTKNEYMPLYYPTLNISKPSNIFFGNEKNVNLNVDNSLYLNNVINPIY